jgi:hypothetical protein
MNCAAKNRVELRGTAVSDTCSACGATLGPSETIHVVGEGPHCYPCFNREIAERIGIDYDAPQFQPVLIEDADGARHTFVIRSILVPTGHELEAVEKTEDDRPGYRFAVLGDFDADPWELFERLFATMRDAVATRHVRRSELGWQLTSDQRLVGRIEWDPESEARLPLVVIDGKAFSWEQVGHMLMTFEGFTLEARVKDTIEVVGDVPSV